jgi:hypothetical protein
MCGSDSHGIISVGRRAAVYDLRYARGAKGYLFYFFGAAEIFSAYGSPSAAVAYICQFLQFVIAKMPLVRYEGSAPFAFFIFFVQGDA